MIKRIQIILKKKGLSPSQFADEIQIQRSSISHILSERNKPSLDFVSKVLERFPELNAEWLIFGKGPMLKSVSDYEAKEEKKNINDQEEIKPKEAKIEKPTTPSLFEEKKKELTSKVTEIEKIVVFYKDNTFKEYTA